MNVRQCVVVRRDLNMTPGLLAAQVAHISAQFMLKDILNGEAKWSIASQQWFKSPVLLVLAVNTPEELDYIIKQAEQKHIDVTIWKDTIKSDIVGDFLEVVVGASFGPENEEVLKQVTGTLPLL